MTLKFKPRFQCSCSFFNTDDQVWSQNLARAMPEASGGSDEAAACFSEDVRRLIAGLDAWDEGVTGLATKLRRGHRAAAGDKAGPGSFSTAASHITAHRHRHHHPVPTKHSSMPLVIPLASTCSISTSFAPLATASILHRSQGKVRSLPAPSFDESPGRTQLLRLSAQPLNECSREPDAGSSQSSSVSTTPSPSIAAMLEAPNAYTDVRSSSADPPGSGRRPSSITAPRQLSGSTQKRPFAGPLESGTDTTSARPVSAPAGGDAANAAGDAEARRPGNSDRAALGSRRRGLEYVDRSPRPGHSNQINGSDARGGRALSGRHAASVSAATGGRGVSPACSSADYRVSVANSSNGRNVRGSAKLGVSGSESGTGGGIRGASTTTRARSHARGGMAASKQGRRRPQADDPINALHASSRASGRDIGHSGRVGIEAERCDTAPVSNASTVPEVSRAEADDGQMAYPYIAAAPAGLQQRAEEPFVSSPAQAANRRQGHYASRATKGASRAGLLRKNEQDPGGMESPDATNGAEVASVRATMEERPEERRDVRPGGSLAVYVNKEGRCEEAAMLRHLLGDLMRDAAAHSVTPGDPLFHPQTEAAELLLRSSPAELIQLLRSNDIGTSRSGCHTRCLGDAAAKRLITSLQKQIGCWTARYDRAVSEAEHRRMQLASSQAKTKRAARGSAVQVAAVALRVHQLTRENNQLHTQLQDFRRYTMRLEQYILRHHAPLAKRITSTLTTPAPPTSLRSGGAADSTIFAAPESPPLDISTSASSSARDAEVAAVEL